jgi:CCR4-NOT complex subunit CAF16
LNLGKSTLLSLLAGRHLPFPHESVELLGRLSFHDTTLNFERVFLNSEWGGRTVHGCPFQADIPVGSLMKQLQIDFPERRDELLKLLNIDTTWRMHQVSEGQRRRVQIFLGLIRPFKVLLIDDILVSLDVVTRQNVLNWLKNESEERSATIM